MHTPIVSSEVEVESEVKPELEQWRSRIEDAWHKTVQSIVEVGKLVKQAKEDLGASYKQLEGQLPFSASTATNFIKIAEHPVLSDSEYWKKLPSAVSTLYYLSMVDEAKLLAYIGSGDITPDLTLVEAKALVLAAPSFAGDRGGGGDGTATRIGYIPVILSIPQPQDAERLLEDLDGLARTHNATLDHPRNRTSVGEWRRQTVLRKALDKITETEGQLTNISLEQLRMLEAATTSLASTSKSSNGSADQTFEEQLRASQLPDNYKNFEALSQLLGETEITNEVIKKWCKDNAVPTQLALLDVEQDVFVWEQLRLVAAREDEKGARRRLKKMAKGKKNASIASHAQEALDSIARFAA